MKPPTTTSDVRHRTLSRAVANIALVGAAIAMGITACTSPQPRVHQVAISNFLYSPDTVVVALGDTVTWTNEDFVPHTVTARDNSFDSQSLAPGATWSWVASTPGVHPYLCTFHPNMLGTIEVR